MLCKRFKKKTNTVSINYPKNSNINITIMQGQVKSANVLTVRDAKCIFTRCFNDKRLTFLWKLIIRSIKENSKYLS